MYNFFISDNVIKYFFSISEQTHDTEKKREREIKKTLKANYAFNFSLSLSRFPVLNYFYFSIIIYNIIYVSSHII